MSRSNDPARAVDNPVDNSGGVLAATTRERRRRGGRRPKDADPWQHGSPQPPEPSRLRKLRRSGGCGEASLWTNDIGVTRRRWACRGTVVHRSKPDVAVGVPHEPGSLWTATVDNGPCGGGRTPARHGCPLLPSRAGASPSSHDPVPYPVATRTTSTTTSTATTTTNARPWLRRLLQRSRRASRRTPVTLGPAHRRGNAPSSPADRRRRTRRAPAHRGRTRCRSARPDAAAPR